MIDHISIDLDIALDQAVYLAIPGWNQPVPPPKLYKRILKHKTWLSTATLKVGPGVCRLSFCPQKLLGNWNAVGSDDLRTLVSQLVPDILAVAGQTITPKLQQLLDTGRYRIRGVHIAYAHYLPHVSQRQFIERAAFPLSLLHRVERGHRGICLHIKAGSRVATFALYDKLRQTLKCGRPRLNQFLAGLSPHQRMFALAAFSHQLAFAATGPRLELRLGDNFFRRSPLADPLQWKPDTARSLYVQHLQKLDLPAAVSVVPNLDLAASRLTAPEFSSFLHWARGDLSLLDQSPSTAARHRRAIDRALGIDVRLPPAQMFGRRRHCRVALGAVLNAQNIVPDSFDAEADGCLDVVYQVQKALERHGSSSSRARLAASGKACAGSAKRKAQPMHRQPKSGTKC